MTNLNMAEGFSWRVFSECALWSKLMPVGNTASFSDLLCD
jgi:hypothetical protein